MNDLAISVSAGRVDFDPSMHFERPRLRRLDRVHQLGLVAARDAVDAFGQDMSGDRTGVIVGTVNRAIGYLEDQYLRMLEKPSRVNPLAVAITMGSSLTGHVCQEFGVTGPSLTVNAECATGLVALATAVDWLELGYVDRVLIGGCDATICFGVVAFFRRMGALTSVVDDSGPASRPFDVERDGFVMSEGAAFAVVEPVSTARAAGRQIVGTILGSALRTDVGHLIAPDSTGVSQERVMTAAMDAGSIGADDVVSVNAHGTSTPANDVVEANAIERVVGDRVPVTAIKGATGHMFAASGLAEALVAARSASTGVVPPVTGLSSLDPEVRANVVVGSAVDTEPGVVLSNSFGFGGHNACVALGPAD